MTKAGCGNKRCDDPSNLTSLIKNQKDETRSREKEQYNRLQLLDYAMKLAYASSDKAKRTGRVTVGRVTAEDVVTHAKRLWKFIETGE